MASSENQKQGFEKAFMEMMFQVPSRVRIQWDGQVIRTDTDGNIPSEPMLNDIFKILPNEFKDRYLVLKEKLRNNRF